MCHNPMELKTAYWLYDFANSAFGAWLAKYWVPTYFATMFAGGVSVDSWGLANSVSIAIWIGLGYHFWKSGDEKGTHVSGLSFLAFGCFLSILALSFTVWKHPETAIFAYVCANAFFMASLGVYDAMLIRAADTSADVHETSGYWWGIGFLWGIIGTAGILAIQKTLGNFHPAASLFVAVFFWVFSWYGIRNLKEIHEWRRGMPLNGDHEWKPATVPRTVWLVGYGLIYCGISVTLVFFWTYATKELWLSAIQIGLSLLFIQAVGIPATIWWTKLFAKIGVRNALSILVGIWTLVIIGLLFPFGKLWYFGTLILAWTAVGNLQSLMRSNFALVSDPEKIWRSFGIFLFVTQAAAFIWPLAYWFLADFSGGQKIPMAASAIGMLVGAALLRKKGR